MRVTDSAIFGLVSLVCTVNATKAIGKPVHAKRQAVATVTSNGCVAVCEGSLSNNKGVDCEVYCTGISSTATSTSTSTTTSTVISTVTSKARAALNRRTVVSASNGACHETCSINEAEGDFDCGWSCDADFSTLMPATSTTKAPLHQRTVVSAVDGDCTAICWDLMPGTECDVQCSSDSKTEMPGNIVHPSGANSSHHLALIFQAPIFLELILLHRFLHHLLTVFTAPSRAARIANLEARQNVQGMPINPTSCQSLLTYRLAYQVHEARLARKFGGLGARDGKPSYPHAAFHGSSLNLS